MARYLMAALVLACGVARAADKYALDGENTKITFLGTKPDGKHEGGFKKLTGTATLTDGAWKMEVEIDTDSLFSDNENLTVHLKSPDFFNVKENPKAKFVSTKIEKGGKPNSMSITGKLTLNGKEKEIAFPATVKADGAFALDAEFKIDRTDFGMTYGKGKVDNEVKLTVKVDAKK